MGGLPSAPLGGVQVPAVRNYVCAAYLNAHFDGIMNRDELEEALRGEGISPRAYSLAGVRKNESLVLERRGKEWVVYYFERDQETDFQPFDDEDGACKYVLSTLTSWPTARVGRTDASVADTFQPWWRRLAAALRSKNRR